jgi:hypothetical protein
MSDLTTGNADLNDIHDLMLANYIQTSRVLDVLYTLLGRADIELAEALKQMHTNGEIMAPSPFVEQEMDKTGGGEAEPSSLI